MTWNVTSLVILIQVTVINVLTIQGQQFLLRLKATEMSRAVAGIVHKKPPIGGFS